MIRLWPRSLAEWLRDLLAPLHPCGDADCTNTEDDHR